jgi:hypothetical protein
MNHLRAEGNATAVEWRFQSSAPAAAPGRLAVGLQTPWATKFPLRNE